MLNFINGHFDIWINRLIVDNHARKEQLNRHENIKRIKRRPSQSQGNDAFILDIISSCIVQISYLIKASLKSNSIYAEISEIALYNEISTWIS
ncbi:hypothetical protein PSN45_001926 [Yamadazyma tenuis]|uniref:uncharacterized protein n=1 Tax=Candida tenuis TaxID=2315449 RepID=UPI00279C0372|nr:hypothetical protein PSN45_001926 [Yamadazyma tenuis]